MEDTVESIHKRIGEKIVYLARAAAPWPEMLDEIDTIHTEYKLGTVDLLHDYYRGDSAASARYQRYISSESYIDKLDDIMCRIRKRLPRSAAVDEALKKYNSLKIKLVPEKIDYGLCDCGDRMVVLPESSEYYCDSCGRTRLLLGTIFRDDQMYTQEGRKTKHNEYDPNRHLMTWLEHIQAQDVKEIPEESLTRIYNYATSDGIDITKIDCGTMRHYLKVLKLTAHNDRIPSLIKKFTGRAPYQLTHLEKRDVMLKFKKITDAYASIVEKKDSMPKHFYYPFFIRKILADKFRGDVEKLSILDGIHLQSADTVRRTDKIYYKICKLCGPSLNIRYEPTDYAEIRRPYY